MPFIDNHGTRIHFKLEGEGFPLVLLHGSTSRLEDWIKFGYVDALQAYFKLILIDARGHGSSGKPHNTDSYALSLRVSDVVAVLDSLSIQRAHYWGYSMGGWIGFGMLQYAMNRLQSIIIGGAHPYADSSTAFEDVDGKDEEEFILAFEKFTGTRLTPDIRNQVVKNDLQALAASLHGRESMENLLSSMTTPSFLYVGENDPRYRKIRMCAEQMPNATFESIRGLDHMQAYVRSDLIVPKVLEFLLTQKTG